MSCGVSLCQHGNPTDRYDQYCEPCRTDKAVVAERDRCAKVAAWILFRGGHLGGGVEAAIRDGLTVEQLEAKVEEGV